MSISQRDVDRVFGELKPIHGGLKEDYFGLLYLEREFDLPRAQAAEQVAFGGHDYGIDGFHVDPERRNLYLFQFKWSKDYASFKGSFQRLIEDGIEQIFAGRGQDQRLNDVILQLKSRLLNDRALIDQVLIHFVFNGEPEDAERSTVLEALREDLEGKKHLLDQFFGRPVSLVIEYRSAVTRRSGGLSHHRHTFKYPVEVQGHLERGGPDGELMHVGFVRLTDLHGIYRDMGRRLLDRNIRAGLSDDEAPNRAIRRALKKIVLDRSCSPEEFAFNHNGVTLSAEHLERDEGKWLLTEPRVLNGAQTLTSFDSFLTSHERNPRLEDGREALDGLWVLCRVITKAKSPFVVTVTINNNRQNPVKPWDLHANDAIQLELQDKFRDELGIYYERQQKMFAALSDDDLEELDITQHKAITLLNLAKTFIVSDGLIDHMSDIRRVFENEKVYGDVFAPSRLRAASGRIVLCYKINFRLNLLIRAIKEMGETKYAFMGKARSLLWALLCQAILNDEELDWYAEEYGESLVVQSGYTDWVRGFARKRARLVIGELIQLPEYQEYVAAEKFGFLRTRRAYRAGMEIASRRWGWTPRRLT